MADDLVNRLWQLDMHPESAPRQAADRIEALEAERDVLRKWDDHFRAACGYKRDGRPSPECFDEWLAKVFPERDSPEAALQAADELARALDLLMVSSEDNPDALVFAHDTLTAYRKARGDET